MSGGEISNARIGKISPNKQSMSIRGFNANISSGGAPEDIWPNGGIQPFASAAGVVSVVSNNAADTSAGTGAREVLVSGVDVNYDPIEETVVMNGTTPVVTTQEFLHVQGAIFPVSTGTRVTSAGSNRHNVGNITFTIGGTVINVIAPETSILESCGAIIPNPVSPFTEPYISQINYHIGARSSEAEELATAAVALILAPPTLTDVDLQFQPIPITTFSGQAFIDETTAGQLEPGTQVRVRALEVRGESVLVSTEVQIVWL